MALPSWTAIAGSGVIVAGTVGTIATGGLLPVVAGGVAGLSLVGSYIYDRSIASKEASNDAARVEVQRLNVVASNPNIATGNSLDDLITNFTKYLPYIIVGLGLVLAFMFMSRSK